MNTPIIRLFGLFLVMFGTLVFASSWWTVFGADGLRDNPNNRRILFEEQRIKRGIIRASDGQVLAANRALPGDRYERRYPSGELFSHPVGFTSLDRGRIGLEEYYNDPLTGRRTDPIGALERLLGPRARRPRTPASAIARAPSWRSTSRPAACSCSPPRRPSTRPTP